MKGIIVILALMACVGCATARVVDFDSGEMDKHQNATELIKVGERITVNTVDGKSVDFEVKAVNEESIEGEKISIPISEIDSVAKVEATPLGVMCAVPIGLAIGWLYIAIPSAIVAALSGL